MKILLLLSLFAAPSLQAAALDTSTFSPDSWSSGLHLLAGLGVNTATFASDEESRDVGLGLNIQTSVGYFFGNQFAVEANTNVMMNSVKRTLIWDTLGTLGIRMRVPTFLELPNSSPYLRIFGGRGPSVFLYKGPRPKELELDGDRTQIEGDVFGLGYGRFQNAKDGSTWFLEFVLTTHVYRRLEAIVEKNQVPEVVASQRIGNHARVHAFSLTFGVVTF